MRRATLLAVTAAAGLTLLPATAAAQNSRFAGISGGATSSDMRGGVTNTNSRWGGTAGLFVGYRSWRMVGVLEANWVQKGGKDAVGDGSTRIDYIEVPFLIGGASEAGGFLIRFYTGIGVGFPIGCNSTSTDPQQNCDLKKSPQWTSLRPDPRALAGRRPDLHGRGRTLLDSAGRHVRGRLHAELHVVVQADGRPLVLLADRRSDIRETGERSSARPSCFSSTRRRVAA